jgi:hypothetical protein
VKDADIICVLVVGYRLGNHKVLDSWHQATPLRFVLEEENNPLGRVLGRT